MTKTRKVILRQRCAQCRKLFDPKRRNQLYCDEKCKNNAAQRRFRERARQALELTAGLREVI